jgi:polyvinyl alcohol dehydrogenase (cytochrome)
MRRTARWLIPILGTLAAVAVAETPRKKAESEARPVAISDDPADWPMYNRDVLGTRHNPAEKTLSKDNVGQLIEKWRFPPRDSKLWIGVVHATVVVNGHVYFGTETNPTFYKLAPDGKVKWAYRDSEPPRNRVKPEAPQPGLPRRGFLNAALVTGDTVYFGSVGGTIYALDRETGKERWKIDTRARPFPGAHASNCVFSSPILAEGNIVVAGGAFEHSVAADPKNTGCTGRGFVVALTPDTGKVVWKYDVGPEPKEFDQPVTIRYGAVERTFQRGPSTSSVWCTPSYDAASHTVFFGTDCHNSPRQPSKDDPSISTKHSCAVIALDARTGAEKWVTQITANDVWSYALPTYDAKTGYKDQAIGDTPKVYTIEVDGKRTKVVGCGSKNGGFYVFDAATGRIVQHTPIYTGPPRLQPKLDPRTLALPGAIGGLQTGCATDGKAVYTNGIDRQFGPPTGGRVVSISLDTTKENWRHERPKVPAVGGTKDKPAFRNVGDPVASGVALANRVVYFTTVVSNKLVALDAATGKVLKEIELREPVWCGPTVSRGRVYVGTGNLLFNPGKGEAYFPKSVFGAVYSFGLPGEDDVDRIKESKE